MKRFLHGGDTEVVVESSSQHEMGVMQMGESTDAAVDRASAAAIEVAEFGSGEPVFTEVDVARTEYVDARATLLWAGESIAELDNRASRKVAEWEAQQAAYQEEQHSTVKDTLVESSGVSREVCTPIENLTNSIGVVELSFLGPAVGLVVGKMLADAKKARTAETGPEA